ncbi:hypothetical protein ACFLU6_05765 [Acidobacteriota bacterium]
MTTLLEVVSEQCERLVAEGGRLLDELQCIGWKDALPVRIKERKELSGWPMPDIGERTIPEQAKMPPDFVQEYHRWYASCLAMVERNMPSRKTEVTRQHDGGKGTDGKALADFFKRDYFTFSDQQIIARGLRHLQAVVGSVPDYVRTTLHDLELAVAQVYVSDQLSEARKLLAHSHVRAAGAIAGVLVERHLKLLCDRQQPPIKYPPKTATINRLNELLRNGGVYDVAQWRKVQWMGDVRNKCDHAEPTEPRKEDVGDLIEDVAKFIALFTG